MKKFFSVILVLISILNAEISDYSLGGYVKTMQTSMMDKLDEDWTSENLIHHRLNFDWYPTQWFEFKLGLRNRIIYGETVETIPNYYKSLKTNESYLSLSREIYSEKSVLAMSELDRLALTFMKDDFTLTAGRQRINWGINFIWNPADIFNAYSYFDFDYEEKPGVDAIRFEWFYDFSSSIQFVFVPKENEELNGYAAYYRFNLKEYDIQLISAYYMEKYIGSLGFSGDLFDGGFRGEGTVFIPKDNEDNYNILTSLSYDYTFDNEIYIQFSGLYHKNGEDIEIPTNLDNIIFAEYLSTCDYLLYYQMRYPFTPLLNGDAGIMYNPDDGSTALTGSFSYSLSDNAEFLFASQLFFGKDNTEFGDSKANFNMRLRYSF